MVGGSHGGGRGRKGEREGGEGRERKGGREGEEGKEGGRERKGGREGDEEREGGREREGGKEKGEEWGIIAHTSHIYCPYQQTSQLQLGCECK